MNPIHTHEVKPHGGSPNKRLFGFLLLIIGTGLALFMGGMTPLGQAAITVRYTYLQPFAICFGVILDVFGFYYLLKG